jgi:L,D-transpeptidase ErfK/SrfK
MTAWAGPLPRVTGEDVVHRVQPKQTLLEVARSYGLGLEHVAWANGLSVQLGPLAKGELTIPLSRILPDPPASDSLVLNLPERGLYHFQDGQFEGFYPVAIGGPGWETPTGNFRISVKSVDPTWFPPAWAGLSGPISPGPDNPLGDRWLGIFGSYGIHGTNRPDSIGGALSHGCIRMYPEKIRKLFDLVAVGTPLRIEYETVRTGWDDAQSRAYVAVFPDVYGRGADVRGALRRGSLDEWVEKDRRFAPTGKLVYVAGERLKLKETGERFVAARRQGRLYASRDLFQAAGVSLQEAGVMFAGHELWPVAETARKLGLRYVLENGTLSLTPGAEAELPENRDQILGD